MFNREIYDSTRKVIKDLTYFLVHVLIYIPANMLIILYSVRSPGLDLWTFIVVILWSVFLILHAIRIYSEKKRKTVHAFMA